MNRQSIYSTICLVSLMFFFTNSLLFIGDLIFDSVAEYYIEQSDLMEGETENENESKTPTQAPTEEEQHVISIEIQDTFGSEMTETINNLYLHSNWKSVPLTTITPPPDHI